MAHREQPAMPEKPAYEPGEQGVLEAYTNAQE
jgi:hypothetical protein